jgi:hypothetical protein
VFAKNDIKANTLLVGSKAASISYRSEWAQNKCLTLNSFTKQLQTPSQSLNLVSMIGKLQNDPYLCKEFYNLYSGPDLNRDEPIDELIIDMSRIQATLTFNSFVNEKNFFEIESAPDESKNDSTKEGGIWIYPSYFNHSCVPNAKRMFYSDFMMIYASEFQKKMI